MTNIVKKLDSSIWRFLEFLILVGGLVWAAAFIRSDINRNYDINHRQDEVIQKHKKQARDIYLRKDVARERYNNIIQQLETINKKLDR